MPALEADIAVIRGRVKEGFSIPFPIDTYYDVVVLPGFSDTHAHPQVVDAGLRPGLYWSSSYEWLLLRELNVDEAALRADIGLSSALAELVLKRALLEGTTLIAFTGRFEANLKAFIKLPVRPRLVVLPTVMKRKGWVSPSELEALFDRYRKFMRDDLLRVGVFVHSLAYGGPDFTSESMRLAVRMRAPLGMHLSEGVSEKRDFLSYACCLDNLSLIAVHCLDDNYRDIGARCSSCPGSNAILYRRILNDFNRITSFGSDWPHLIGTTGSQLPLILKLYRGVEGEVLFKATVGGYEDYGIPYAGDIVAYDGSLRKVLEGRSLPGLVSVAGSIAVEEGRLVFSGETLDDIIKATKETIAYAVDVYGKGEMPYMPTRQELEDYMMEALSRTGEVKVGVGEAARKRV